MTYTRCPYKQGLGSEVQCVLQKGHKGKHLWHPDDKPESKIRITVKNDKRDLPF
jgi:hypothetical protein